MGDEMEMLMHLFRLKGFHHAQCQIIVHYSFHSISLIQIYAGFLLLAMSYSSFTREMSHLSDVA